MDRLGVPFNRTPEGFRDQRRFGGTLFKRTAFAGATTGQQLLYALDEQVRRWEVAGKVKKYEFWDFLGPILDDNGRCRGCVAQDLVTMEIRAFPADAVIVGSGGCGLIYGRSTMSMACTGSAASRCFQAGANYANGEFIQVHPTAIPGADKLRLMSESARGEGGRVWVPRKPQDPRDPRTIPEAERYYFLEERYPKYGNLVPRDIATREIFNVCTNEGLSVEQGPAVRVSRPDAHPARRARSEAGRHSRDLRKVPGRRSARRADEDLPRRPLLDGRPVGRLRTHRRRRLETRLAAQSADEHSRPVRHRRVRLSVSRRESPGRELALELHLQRPDRRAGRRNAARVAQRRQRRRSAGLAVRTGSQAAARNARYALLQPARRRRESVPAPPGAGQRDDQGRHRRAANNQLAEAYGKVCELEERAKQCSLSDTGNWTNQNVVFTKALRDMFPLAKAISERRSAARRMPRRPLQAGVRHARLRCRPTRPSAPPGGEAVVRSLRGEHAQLAQNHDRQALARRRAAAQLRGRRYLAHPAAAPAVRPGRRRHHRKVWKERQAAKTPATAGNGNGQSAGPAKVASAETKPNQHLIFTMSHNDHSSHAESANGHSHDGHATAARVVRCSRPPAGCPRPGQLLGALSRALRARHERDQRAAADRRHGHNRRRRARGPRGLGLQLPGRSLRRLHDGHQRPRAAGLLGAGRSAAGRQSGRNRAAPDGKVSRRPRSDGRSLADVPGAQAHQRLDSRRRLLSTTAPAHSCRPKCSNRRIRSASA